MSYEHYSEWKRWTSGDFGSWTPDEGLFFRKEICPLLPRESEKEIRIFELGFGNGGFLGWAKNQGFTISGSEIQEELMRRATEAGFAAFKSIDALEPGTLDLVVAFDVFEHIPYRELVNTCGAIATALKPGGFLVARFPNGDSPFALRLQNADSTHVLSIGSGIAEELMRMSGLEVLKLRAPAEVAVGVKSKLVQPLKRLLRSMLMAYVRLAYLGGATPSTYAINYLLVARKPLDALH